MRKRRSRYYNGTDGEDENLPVRSPLHSHVAPPPLLPAPPENQVPNVAPIPAPAARVEENVAIVQPALLVNPPEVGPVQLAPLVNLPEAEHVEPIRVAQGAESSVLLLNTLHGTRNLTKSLIRHQKKEETFKNTLATGAGMLLMFGPFTLELKILGLIFLGVAYMLIIYQSRVSLRELENHQRALDSRLLMLDSIILPDQQLLAIEAVHANALSEFQENFTAGLLMLFHKSHTLHSHPDVREDVSLNRYAGGALFAVAAFTSIGAFKALALQKVGDQLIDAFYADYHRRVATSFGGLIEVQRLFEKVAATFSNNYRLQLLKLTEQSRRDLAFYLSAFIIEHIGTQSWFERASSFFGRLFSPLRTLGSSRPSPVVDVMENKEEKIFRGLYEVCLERMRNKELLRSLRVESDDPDECNWHAEELVVTTSIEVMYPEGYTEKYYYEDSSDKKYKSRPGHFLEPEWCRQTLDLRGERTEEFYP